MAEEEKNLPSQEEPETEADTQPKSQEKAKTPWQIQKESWYDKVPLNLKQLDIIIVVCWILLGLTVLAMYLDTKGIVNIF